MIRLRASTLAHIAAACALTACHSGSAGSGGDQASSPDSFFPSGGGGGIAGVLAQAALKRCIAGWGQTPFSDDQVQNARRISAVVDVQGSGASLNDTVATSGPELVLVGAAVNVEGATTYNLLNPNGWYCVETGVNVLAQTTIDLACSAHLADGVTEVDIGATAQPGSVTGVEVNSTVQLSRVGCTNPE